MIDKKPEYMDSEKVQWITDKIGYVMQLVAEPKVDIVIEDFNRRLSAQEAAANGNDSEKATLAVTFSGKKSTASAKRAKAFIKKQQALKNACISLPSDSQPTRIDFDLERLSKLEERDFASITKAITEEALGNIEKTLGKRHQKSIKNYETDAVLQRISPVIKLMVKGLNLTEQSDIYRDEKTLFVKLCGKDGAEAVNTIRMLINNTPLQDAYIKPTFEELILPSLVRQDWLFNTEHKGEIILKNKYPVYEIKFDFNKLAAIPKEKLDAVIISAQGIKRTKTNFFQDFSNSGRQV